MSFEMAAPDNVFDNTGSSTDKPHASHIVLESKEKLSYFEAYIQAVSIQNGILRKMVDSFKPARSTLINASDTSSGNNEKTIATGDLLKRQLKRRHIQMIAVGGSIGSGLFIGSGNSLANGGPAALVIGFISIGAMLICTMHALGELAVRFPVSGGFSVHFNRFLDRSWGFAMGWNYALQWLIVFPLELIAAAVAIGYWDESNAAMKVNKAAWTALFYVIVALVNIFGVRVYGEAEFLFSLIKVIGIVGFCLFGIVIAAGGGPNHQYLGMHYWNDPGAFANSFKGVVSVFVNAAFSFSGTELSGLAAAETERPATSLPKAVKLVFWRVLLFYVLSQTIVGMLVPHNDSHLGVTSDGTSSPFVIAIERAGISVLPSVMNGIILVAIISVANAAVYGCSRTLAALGSNGHAPRILGYVDREGRPLVGILICLCFGLLCFLSATKEYKEVFDWLLAFSGLSSIFTWGSINLTHIRFRRAMKVQGRSLNELTFKAGFEIWGSLFGLGMNIAILALQLWVAVWPLHETPNVKDFFKAYLSPFVIFVFYISHKIWTRNWIIYVRAKDIDLDSDTREAVSPTVPIDKTMSETVKA